MKKIQWKLILVPVSEDSSYWESTVRNLIILQYAWNILKPQQTLLFTF